MGKNLRRFALAIALCMLLCLLCACTKENTQGPPPMPTRPAVQPTPTTTQPQTDPSVPPTEPGLVYDPVPPEYINNYYLVYKGSGFCERLTGDVLVTVIFVTDPVSGWDEAGMQNVQSIFDAELADMEQDAAAFGVKLDMQVQYLTANIHVPYDSSDLSDAWEQAALQAAGLPKVYYYQGDLERQHAVDHAPIVYVINQLGRSFAYPYSGGIGFERLVIYSNGLDSLRHELFHLFGAVDFYFPQETVDAAREYLGDSIMGEADETRLDDLTAYLIGWRTDLSEDALAFLEATNDLSWQYILDAQGSDSFTGYGTREFDNGVYIGDLVAGVPHGEGTYEWFDGTVYTGSWVYNKLEGFGKLTFIDGSYYEGEWANDQCNGQGTYVFSNGDRYEGHWENDYMNGEGQMWFANGDHYAGQWLDGWMNGDGTMTYANGNVYTGSWRYDQRHGEGVMKNKNGNTYTGQWAEDFMHGYGVYTWSDGSRYEGNWQRNLRHGQGTYYGADGTVQEGFWNRGEFLG